jgi:hypothetical protein
MFGPQVLITWGRFVRKFFDSIYSDTYDMEVLNMMHPEVLMRPQFQFNVGLEWWSTSRTTLMRWAILMGVDTAPIGAVLERLKTDRIFAYFLNLPRMRANRNKLGKMYGYAFLQNLAEPSCPMLLGCHIALFLGRGVPEPLGGDEVEKWGTINGKLSVWGSLFH